MSQMVRQNQKAFDQAGGQHHDHRKRNIRDQIAKAPADNHQTKERNDRCDRRRKHRAEHAPCSALCRDGRRFAQFPDPEIRVFAHDNRVIHHDPQGDNQRKKRDHVDRDPHRIHQRDSRQHGDGNPKSDPKGRSRVQKQEQQANHQHQPGQPVIKQDIQTPLDQLCTSVGQRDRHTFRQGG